VAAELVPQFKDGVFWVALASVTRPDDVVTSISSALGAKAALEAHIGQRHMLLLLDNFEQVVAAAPELSDLLRACPRLHLLVASRTLLRIDGEQEYGVPPLPPADAVALFRARSAVDAPDELVHEICRRVDFLPLAVELAAARTRLLAPQDLLARLDQRLPLLTGGRRDAPDRQRTLRRTIEWSHDLLEAPERQLFARLAVFAGSFSPAAAEDVADADLDLLQSLVEQSLLRRWSSGRLGMLETIHEFALEQLEATGQADVLRRRHAEHLLALIRSAALSDEALGRSRADLVRPEIGNLRAALAWTLQRGEHELGVLLVVEAEHFWVGSYPFEAVRWLELLLAPPAQLPDHVRARALKAAGGVTFIVGRFEQGARLYEQSLALYRRLGDTRGCAVLLYRMATYWLTRDDTARAREVAEQSRALLHGTEFHKEQAIVTGTLGGIAFREGDTEGGLALIQRSGDEAERLGFTWWQVHMTAQLADHLTLLGRLDEAERPARQSLALAHEVDEQQTRMYNLALLARLAADTGRLERAGTLWGALEAQEAHGPVGQWEDEREGYLALLPKDDEAFVRGLASGRALGLEAAVAYATEEP
jgi:predicted ATPase